MGPVFQVESLQTGDEVPCIARGHGKGAVVGDLVYYEAVSNLLADGLILEFSPRQSLLRRTDSGGRRAQLIAANLDVIFIVVAPLPELREGLIDRYLVAASSQDIEAEIRKLTCSVEDHQMDALCTPGAIATFDRLGE